MKTSSSPFRATGKSDGILTSRSMTARSGKSSPRSHRQSPIDRFSEKHQLTKTQKNELIKSFNLKKYL